MNDDRNVWIFIEQEEGKLADVGLELLAKGGELAHALGSQVWALLLGHQVEALAELVIHHGADRDHADRRERESTPDGNGREDPLGRYLQAYLVRQGNVRCLPDREGRG